MRQQYLSCVACAGARREKMLSKVLLISAQSISHANWIRACLDINAVPAEIQTIARSIDMLTRLFYAEKTNLSDHSKLNASVNVYFEVANSYCGSVLQKKKITLKY